MSKTSGIETRFGRWFRRGSGGDPGYYQVVHRWLLLDLIIGLGFALLVTKPIDAVGDTVLLPLAAILVGMVFAWAGSAQSLLQTDEVYTVTSYAPGGLSDYVFGFQVAILSILVTCVLWGAAGLSIFEPLLPHHHPDAYLAIKVVLYGLISLGIRECWSMVTMAQGMLLMRAALQPDNNAASQQATTEASSSQRDDAHDERVSNRHVKGRRGDSSARCIRVKRETVAIASEGQDSVVHVRA